MPSVIDTGAAVAAAVPGGAPAAGVLAVVSTVWKQIGSLFSGSPPVTWEQAHELAIPTATRIVTNLTETFDDAKLQRIFVSYTSKLKSYIKDSPHNPTQKQKFIDAVNREAIDCGGGFKPDGFPFSSLIQVQLAWAVWLHSHWLYGGVSQDEVGNGGALKKFEDSLNPTLILAVQETEGVKATTSGAVSTVQAKPKETVETVEKKHLASLGSFFENPWMIGAVVLVGVFLLMRKG
jgi:hypothetical protein